MLEQSGLDLSVNNFYAGGFLHVDDIRNLATSTGSVEVQVMVKDFAARNFLKLNVQGDLSPLSTRSIIETCVMPILLFGSENWIVSGGIREQLESFLGELAKRALKWPRHFSNTAALTVLDLESVIVAWKLGFLKRQLAVGAMGVAAMAMRSLLDDPDSLSSWKMLEEYFGTNYTDAILKVVMK